RRQPVPRRHSPPAAGPPALVRGSGPAGPQGGRSLAGTRSRSHHARERAPARVLVARRTRAAALLRSRPAGIRRAGGGIRAVRTARARAREPARRAGILSCLDRRRVGNAGRLSDPDPGLVLPGDGNARGAAGPRAAWAL